MKILQCQILWKVNIEGFFLVLFLLVLYGSRRNIYSVLEMRPRPL